MCFIALVLAAGRRIQAQAPQERCALRCCWISPSMFLLVRDLARAHSRCRRCRCPRQLYPRGPGTHRLSTTEVCTHAKPVSNANGWQSLRQRPPGPAFIDTDPRTPLLPLQQRALRDPQTRRLQTKQARCVACKTQTTRAGRQRPVSYLTASSTAA